MTIDKATPIVISVLASGILQEKVSGIYFPAMSNAIVINDKGLQENIYIALGTRDVVANFREQRCDGRYILLNFDGILYCTINLPL